MTDYANISEQWHSGLAHNDVKQRELDEIADAANYDRWDRAFQNAIIEATRCNRRVATVEQKSQETVPESLLRELRRHFTVTREKWQEFGEECHVNYGWRKFLRIKTRPVTVLGWRYIVTLP